MNLKNKSYEALRKCRNRFVKRSDLSYRRTTHFRTSLPKDTESLIFRFLNNIIRKILNITDYHEEYNRIINVDETPLFLEMQSKITLDLKGNITITTFRKNKIRVSCILAMKKLNINRKGN